MTSSKMQLTLIDVAAVADWAAIAKVAGYERQAHSPHSTRTPVRLLRPSSRRT